MTYNLTLIIYVKRAIVCIGYNAILQNKTVSIKLYKAYHSHCHSP